jgi:hypothetical protein
MKGGWCSPQQPPCSDDAGEENLHQSGASALTMPSQRRESWKVRRVDPILIVFSDWTDQLVLFCGNLGNGMDTTCWSSSPKTQLLKSSKVLFADFLREFTHAS